MVTHFVNMEDSAVNALLKQCAEETMQDLGQRTKDLLEEEGVSACEMRKFWADMIARHADMVGDCDDCDDCIGYFLTIENQERIAELLLKRVYLCIDVFTGSLVIGAFVERTRSLS